jgi:hypothetical protein
VIYSQLAEITVPVLMRTDDAVGICRENRKPSPSELVRFPRESDCTGRVSASVRYDSGRGTRSVGYKQRNSERGALTRDTLVRICPFVDAVEGVVQVVGGWAGCGDQRRPVASAAPGSPGGLQAQLKLVLADAQPLPRPHLQLTTKPGPGSRYHLH